MFSLNVKDNNIFPCYYIRLSYNIYKCFNALPIRRCMSTSNSKHGNFLFKNNEITYQKGRALMQMYSVVPQTIRGNYHLCSKSWPKNYISRILKVLKSSLTCKPLLSRAEFDSSTNIIRVQFLYKKGQY